ERGPHAPRAERVGVAPALLDAARARTANRRALGDLDLVEPTVLATPALAGLGAILGPGGRTADVPHLAAGVTDLAIEVARALQEPARLEHRRAAGVPLHQ